jgi:hypothetical protein
MENVRDCWGAKAGRGITYGMASRQWLDIQECEDFVGFEELEGGDVPYCFQMLANRLINLGWA